MICPVAKSRAKTVNKDSFVFMGVLRFEMGVQSSNAEFGREKGKESQ
jgi:hypothetical protein